MDNLKRRRRTKSGEAGPPPGSPSGNKKGHRYNLRNKKDDEVVWVDDDTLKIDPEDTACQPPPAKKPRIEVESDDESNDGEFDKYENWNHRCGCNWFNACEGGRALRT